ncbi:hypothetical protein T09_1356 [Trichinella sp. T9]|nr:hypothetical protein T09_1356 [Trichinella sp. T9]
MAGAVLGIALPGACTSRTLPVYTAENGQTLMAGWTRRKLLRHKWPGWILFLPRSAFSKSPFFPVCRPSAHPPGSFRYDHSA